MFPSVGEMHPAPHPSARTTGERSPLKWGTGSTQLGGASKRQAPAGMTGGTPARALPLLLRPSSDLFREAVGRPFPECVEKLKVGGAAADRCPRGALRDHSRPALGRRPLERAVELKASDLHLTAGSHPAVRLHGHIELLEDFPVLDPDIDARADLPHHDDRAAEAAGAQPPARLRVRHPRPRPLPRQRLLPARVDRRRVPHDPHRHQVASRSSACRRASTSSPASLAASCSSPARPARASRRRSPR